MLIASAEETVCVFVLNFIKNNENVPGSLCFAASGFESESTSLTSSPKEERQIIRKVD